MKPRLVAGLACLMAASLACGSTITEGTGASVQTVVVHAPRDTLHALGRTVRLTATAENAAGTTIPGQQFVWASSNAAVLRVDSTGLATAVAAGTTSVRATAGGVTGTHALTVVQVPTSFAIINAPDTLTSLGDIRDLQAAERDAGGAAIPGRQPIWSVPDTTVLVVSRVGHLRTRANGAAVVTAALDPFTAQARIVVQQRVASIAVTAASPAVAISDTLRFAAVPLDGLLHPVPDVPITSWSVTSTYLDSTGLGTVDSTGLFHALTRGNGMVLARAGGQIGGRIVSVVLRFLSVAGGGVLSCGNAVDRTTYCWGHGYYYYSQPVQLSTPASVTHLVAGEAHGCGLAASGEAFCWGDNGYGQLGIGTTGSEVLVPAAVSGGHAFVQISAGDYHTCGLTVTGTVYCWGLNDSAQVGDGVGAGAPHTTPTLVAGGLTFLSVAAGAENTCALAADSTAYCWGATNGLAGDSAVASPTPVAGGLAFAAITTASTHTCALTAAGVAYCFGRNERGELGLGFADSTVRTTPTPVTGSLVFTRVVASQLAWDNGSATTCGIATSGILYCWGGNGYAQLGDGDLTGDQASPTLVLHAGPWIDLSHHGEGGCAVSAAHIVYCWGFGVAAPSMVQGQ